MPIAMPISARRARTSLAAAAIAAAAGVAGCGGGNPLANPDDVLNPPGQTGQKLSFRYYQQYINPIFDQSRWTTIAARWKDCQTVFTPVMKDCGVICHAYTWLKGDPAPYTMFGPLANALKPTRSCVILSFEDQSRLTVFEAMQQAGKGSAPLRVVTLCFRAGIIAAWKPSMGKEPTFEDIAQALRSDGLANHLESYFKFLSNMLTGEQALKDAEKAVASALKAKAGDFEQTLRQALRELAR